jgi:beta-mannosidase
MERKTGEVIGLMKFLKFAKPNFQTTHLHLYSDPINPFFPFAAIALFPYLWPFHNRLFKKTTMRFRLAIRNGFFILCLPFVLLACQQVKQPATQYLHSGWQLVNPLTQQLVPAEVPGNVHTDLMQAGLIPDPFFGTNEDSVQWVTQQRWVYQTIFELDAVLREYDNLELVFEGLDSYADIYLNDSLVLQTDNMFRSWQLEVNSLLLQGPNVLRIVFHPADSINLLNRDETPFGLPEERALTRKAPYQFGWDWGPEFPTMGIWKDVKLQGWSKAKIENYTFHQLSVDSAEARLMLDLEIQSRVDRAFQLEVLHKGRKFIDQTMQLHTGNNRIQLPFIFSNPKLWWPNGMGDQPLYNFEIRLIDGNKPLDHKQLKTGFRQIELVTEPDSVGESFYFKVNGKAVFAKGANYIPEDNFLNRTSRSKTRKLLSDAAAVNMNMIRVWGGGIYPEDYFYEIADSLGLLIWQDFMFACTMYPFDDDFLANVEQEAAQQIKRLRKYPSLAIWCGNNEVDEGFHNWGWQQSLGWTDADSAAIWKGYLSLFEELLPELVSRYDSLRPYWPSSPSTGWGRSESLLQGDVHYWGVWWGEEPFEVYEEKVGRFHSEYGFQAMPHLATIEAFTNVDDRFVGSEVMESHQKHPRGTRLIDDYMRRDFPVPAQFEDYIFVSQLVQSHGIVKAIEAHRRAMPLCMGTLYWQLNDCWPVTSWSSIDYYGRWKALHYHLKQAYAPLLFSTKTVGDSLEVYLLNDKAKSFQGRLEMDIISFDGNVLFAITEPLSVERESAAIVKKLSLKALLQGVDPLESVFRLRFAQGIQIVTEKLHYFDSPAQLELPQADVNLRVSPKGNALELTLQSNVLVKNLMLSSNDVDGFFEDNFFDMQPGSQRRISFKPSGKKPISQVSFEMVSLNDVMHR